MSEEELIDIFEGMDGSEMIQSTFLFGTLSFSEATALASEFEHRSFLAKATIIDEGAIGRALYLIKSGTVEVLKNVGDRREVIATLSTGELFGEMSLIENELTSATIRAQDDVECYMLDSQHLYKMMATDDAFARKIYQAFCQTLSERLRVTTNELTSLKREMTENGS